MHNKIPVNFEQGELFVIPTDLKPTSQTPSVLDLAIENFMQFVELEPGDPGYFVNEDGVGCQQYIRHFSEDIWGSDADVFELRFIERRLEELRDLFYFGAGNFIDILESKGLIFSPVGRDEVLKDV